VPNPASGAPNVRRTGGGGRRLLSRTRQARYPRERRDFVSLGGGEVEGEPRSSANLSAGWAGLRPRGFSLASTNWPTGVESELL
jgi:hypothetical protein